MHHVWYRFQLVLTDKLRSALAQADEHGQPTVQAAAVDRMAKMVGYTKSAEADNVATFHGREVDVATKERPSTPRPSWGRVSSLVSSGCRRVTAAKSASTWALLDALAPTSPVSSATCSRNGSPTAGSL